MTTIAPLRRGDARVRLLDAAVMVVREKGFAATSIDELCARAGVTKGAFFHHFASKDALGAAAARHWSETTAALFAAAPYHAPADPLDRVLAYLDFRRTLIAGEIAEFTCMAGTMAQEAFLSSPAIRAACFDAIAGHAATLEADLDAAIAARGVADVTARGLALHSQAAMQGGFILAKAAGDAAPAIEAIDHLRRYFTLLFDVEKEDRT